MGDSAISSTSLVIAIVSAITSVIANYQSRQAQKDKYLFEQQMHRDKLEFDKKVIELEDRIKECEQNRLQLHQCIERSNIALETTRNLLEKERSERHFLEGRIALLESLQKESEKNQNPR